MGKPKPKLVPNIEFEWVESGGIFGRPIEYARKTRLKCCPDMERMSNTWGPFYFYDKHYPERNGFYECEMARSISEGMN
jgi:hypothetical protein